MGFALSSLRDDFVDNAISSSAWVSAASGSATVAETVGEIRFTLPSSAGAGPHTARLTSRYVYSLVSDSFYVNIDTMVATGVAATAFFQLYLSGSNALQWIQLSNTIYVRTIIAGTSVDRFSAGWSATTYKYLRIRGDTTTVYWDSSTNGTSWTNRFSMAFPFSTTDLYVDFGATCGNVASPGSFRIEDVNLILPALSTNWRWTNARRALVNRHKRSTIAIDTANTAQGYIVTADGVDASDAPSGNVRYWSGPAGGGRLLTEQPDEASAQTMAVNLPLDGTFDLPEQIDMRLVRLGHRSVDGSAYILREFYPRRLVQSDDIEAESIRAINIAAHQITADHIAVINLNAEAYITAGDGAVILDDDGITIVGDDFDYDLSNISPVTIPRPNRVEWTETTASTAAAIAGSDAGQLLLLGDRITLAVPDTSTDSYGLDFTNAYTRMDTAVFSVRAIGSTGPTAFRVTPDVVDAADSLTEVSGDLNVAQGLNIGTATGATAGQILATISDAGTTTAPDVLIVGHNSSGTPSTNFGSSILMLAESSTTADQAVAQLVARWATATHASRKGRLDFFVSDTAARFAMRLEASGTAALIGFLGASAVARQTLGAAATDAATTQTLANNIRTALINLGLGQA